MSEQYQNVTSVEQGIYTKWGQIVMVKPGQTVSSEKLGYAPDPSTGFLPVSKIAALLKKEAPGSKNAIKANLVSEAPQPIQVPNETRPAEMIAAGQKFEIDRETSPSYYAAVQALLSGKKVEDTITIPTEKDREHQLRVYEQMNSSAPKPRPSTIQEIRRMIPANAQGVIASIDPDMVDTETEVPMMDPLLAMRTSQEYPKSPEKQSEGFVVPAREQPIVPEKPDEISPNTSGDSSQPMVRFPRVDD